MQEITSRIKTTIPAQEIIRIENWWKKLSPENQQELQSLYLAEENVDEALVSIYLCGEFVEQERKHISDIFWINHFYDYIINHELFEDFNHPTIGGICSATNLAEQSIRKGLFAYDYRCPLKKKDCVVERLLSRKSGQAYELYLVFKLEKGRISVD